MKTIKYFVSAAFFFVCLAPAATQGNYGEFRWGVKAGANFGNASNTDNVEKDNGKTGFTGGAFCKIPLGTYISLRPELLFTMKGAAFTFPSDIVGQTDKLEYSLNYLELPLSVDFEMPFFLDLQAGIQGAYLLSNSVKVNGSEGKSSDNIEKGEFGWHIGTGIDLGNIGVHVRYHQSLTSFYNAVTYGAGEVELKNWGISLTASYLFAL